MLTAKSGGVKIIFHFKLARLGRGEEGDIPTHLMWNKGIVEEKEEKKERRVNHTHTSNANISTTYTQSAFVDSKVRCLIIEKGIVEYFHV